MYYNPEKVQREAVLQMLRVMVIAALADGAVDDGKRRSIESQYLQITGMPVGTETLEREISLARSSGADLNSFVAKMSGDLSSHGRATVVRLAFITMSASGELQPGHQQQLGKLAKTLEIPQDQYMALISKLSELPTDSSH